MTTQKHKVFSFLLAALILSATSCADNGSTGSSSQNAVNSSVSNKLGDGKSLTVLASKETNIALLAQLSALKYSGLSVELITKETYGLEDEQEFYNKIAGEIMTGGGPDIISPHIFKNIPKAVESGVFEDLTPYVEKDNGFNKADYSGAVLNASTFDDKLMFVPLTIRMPLYVTTSAYEQKYNFDGKSIYQTVNTLSQNNISGNPYEHYFEPLVINDYLAKTSELGTPEFLSFIKERRMLSAQVETKNNLPVPCDKTPLIYAPGNAALDTVATLLSEDADKPIIMPARDEQGRYTAFLSGLGINAASQNKQSAYAFLSIAFTMTEDIKEYKKIKNGEEKHEEYLSLIDPKIYSIYANQSMQKVLLEEQFEMYKSGTIYSANNSIVNADKLPKDDLISQYLSFYQKLDNCVYTPCYRYTGDLSDYVYNKNNLTDDELVNVLKKENDKAVISLSE